MNHTEEVYMNVVRVKPGVEFTPIAPAGFRILAALVNVAAIVGRDLEITSGTDSHASNDVHALGEAYDISVNDFDTPTIAMIRAGLVNQLGALFTVLYETPTKPTDVRLQVIAFVNPGATGPHIHVQRRNGTVYPPIAAPATASA
jgi:hypothetical protein